ncbi:uncharacterized protein [Diabrotica undecimpunctata]|uniref:uncharacterized protein n=1 Tax=Diabrotica undecimpunctata TaxID=50387 RepID=UPI003B63B81D
MVPFLDTNVTRHEDNTVRLDWYRKKTFSGRYVPFHSYHPDEHQNIIKGLKIRIKRICHPSNYNKNIKLLYEILRKNHYPKMLLNKLLFQDMPTARTHQRQTLEGGPVELFYGRLPYIRGSSQQITNLFIQFNLVIANSVYKRLGTYFTHLTERVKKLDNFNVVYSISCGSCSEVYVGQTSQKLSKRIALHKSDVVRKPTSTAFSQHIKNTGHIANYENVEVLKRVDNQCATSITAALL